VLVRIDDANIDTVEDLFAELRQRKPGSQARLTFIRDGGSRRPPSSWPTARLATPPGSPVSTSRWPAREVVPGFVGFEVGSSSGA